MLGYLNVNTDCWIQLSPLQCEENDPIKRRSGRYKEAWARKQAFREAYRRHNHAVFHPRFSGRYTRGKPRKHWGIGGNTEAVLSFATHLTWETYKQTVKKIWRRYVTVPNMFLNWIFFVFLEKFNVVMLSLYTLTSTFMYGLYMLYFLGVCMAAEGFNELNAFS